MNEINQSVQVAMLFRAGEVQPAAFLWQGHRYDVTKILLAHKTRLGDVLAWHFTVETKGGGVAKLRFDTLSLHWQLETIEA